jgi:predicted dehydrogenase
MIKVGIIGSGFGLYGLLPAFNSTRGCRVAVICGRKSKRLVDYCESIGLEKIYTDWQEMLRAEKLDAVAIAVTPSAQYQIAKFALAQGHHIFAEKPLAATYKQAKELLDLAKKKRVKHIVDFIFPEIEEWRSVKDFLDRKTFGKLREIVVDWQFKSYISKSTQPTWKNDIKQGGGAVAYYFSHSLYYLEFFAGPIVNLKSKIIYLGKKETGVELRMKFKGGIGGQAHLNSNSNLNHHRLRFVCDNGTIVLENREESYTSGFTIEINKEGYVRRLKTGGEEERRVLDEDDRVRVVKKLTARFVDSIIHNRKIVPSFREGARVQELIEKIREQQ